MVTNVGVPALPLLGSKDKPLTDARSGVRSTRWGSRTVLAGLGKGSAFVMSLKDKLLGFTAGAQMPSVLSCNNPLQDTESSLSKQIFIITEIQIGA